MPLMIPPPSSGGGGVSKKFIPGDYISNGAVNVTTTSIEILPDNAASLRFITVNTSGADIFISYASDPTTTDFDFKIPAGTQILDYPVNGQQLKAISASGTAVVQIAVAPAVAINIE